MQQSIENTKKKKKKKSDFVCGFSQFRFFNFFFFGFFFPLAILIYFLKEKKNKKQ